MKYKIIDRPKIIKYYNDDYHVCALHDGVTF